LRPQLLAATTSLMSSVASVAVLWVWGSLLLGPPVLPWGAWYFWPVARGLQVLSLLLSLLAFGVAVLTIYRRARVLGFMVAAPALWTFWWSVDSFLDW
jgi:hypothetical protein